MKYTTKKHPSERWTNRVARRCMSKTYKGRCTLHVRCSQKLHTKVTHRGTGKEMTEEKKKKSVSRARQGQIFCVKELLVASAAFPMPARAIPREGIGTSAAPRGLRIMRRSAGVRQVRRTWQAQICGRMAKAATGHSVDPASGCVQRFFCNCATDDNHRPFACCSCDFHARHF